MVVKRQTHNILYVQEMLKFLKNISDNQGILLWVLSQKDEFFLQSLQISTHRSTCTYLKNIWIVESYQKFYGINIDLTIYELCRSHQVVLCTVTATVWVLCVDVVVLQKKKAGFCRWVYATIF